MYLRIFKKEKPMNLTTLILIWFIWGLIGLYFFFFSQCLEKESFDFRVIDILLLLAILLSGLGSIILAGAIILEEKNYKFFNHILFQKKAKK